MPMLEGETMSKRCDNCRWWDNEPDREIRAAPNQEPGRYGDCSVPLPISLSVHRYATVADAPIQGDTNAEKCQCFVDRYEAMMKQKMSTQIERGEIG